MKKQQPKRIKTKKGNKKWFWVAVVVLFAVLLGGVLHHHLQTSAQNKTFKDAQSWLQGVMDEVAIQVPGGNRVSESYCTRSSVKYGQGGRYCVTEENILYPVNKDNANTYANNIQTFLEDHEGLRVNKLGTTPSDTVLMDYSFKKEGLSCYITYYGLYGRSSFSYMDEIRNFNDGLRVSMSCSGDAMADYFTNRY